MVLSLLQSDQSTWYRCARDRYPLQSRATCRPLLKHPYKPFCKPRHQRRALQQSSAPDGCHRFHVSACSILHMGSISVRRFPQGDSNGFCASSGTLCTCLKICRLSAFFNSILQLILSYTFSASGIVFPFPWRAACDALEGHVRKGKARAGHGNRCLKGVCFPERRNCPLPSDGRVQTLQNRWTDKGTRTKNLLNRQNYPKRGLLSDKIAHFCYQQHCYWKKSRSIFFSLHHIVPVQFHKDINPEAAPVPTLKVEI